MNQLPRAKNAVHLPPPASRELGPRMIAVDGAPTESRAALCAHTTGVTLLMNANVHLGSRTNPRRRDHPNRTDEQIKRILTGLVDSLKAIRAAEQDVKYTASAS